ncbi:MAG: hypothetical protein Q8S27_11900, partial [Hoeflea sp.]|nr:hypothetical protein [Hoeflea sp.]
MARAAGSIALSGQLSACSLTTIGASLVIQVQEGISVFHGKVLVAQGGGPTAVINQSMVGAV